MYGVQGAAVDFCLRQADVLIGRFIKAAKDAGIYNDVNFVIMGDHGQLDVKNVFNLNILLRKHGFIRAGNEDSDADYDAYSFSAGFSTHIMMRNPCDKEMKVRLHLALLEIEKEYPQYIERVYTAEEILLEESLSGDFSFVIEGTEGTMFMDALEAGLIIPYGTQEYTFLRAMHGHHPAKGEKPPFIAFGPSITPGVIIDGGDMLDICPTLAALAGVEMPQMTGTCFPFLFTG